MKYISQKTLEEKVLSLEKKKEKQIFGINLKISQFV